MKRPACGMIKQFKSDQGNTSLIDHSFNILHTVGQGDYTKWSIVYDISNRKIYFKTNAAPQIKSVSFSAFQFSCQQQALFFNMNELMKGEVSNAFKPLSEEANKKMLRETAELSKVQVNISAQTQAEAVRYASQIGCQ